MDRREPGKIWHTLAEVLGQRIFGIACGHPDGNDANHLADDPIHKLRLGRDPVGGEALASQPTISRFENGVGRSAPYELGRELAMRVIERHQHRLDGRARRITIDLDPTDDATHGPQQLTFFNGHDDRWCYLPLLAFLSFDQQREQYLCAAMTVEAEELYERAFGAFEATDLGEQGFTSRAIGMFSGRRRLDAWHHNPSVKVLGSSPCEASEGLERDRGAWIRRVVADAISTSRGTRWGGLP